jgi:predicted outer membrane repeat protein
MGADPVTITNCRFLYNRNPLDRGGGCYIHSAGQIFLANNIFYHNEGSGDGGGGLYISTSTSSAELHFYNNTILQNTSIGKGGGIYVDSSGNARQYIWNNIIRSNNATLEGHDIYVRHHHVSCYSSVYYNDSSFAPLWSKELIESIGDNV